MNNMNELRAELSLVFEDLRKKRITHKEADSLANISGKMINSVKVQLEYEKNKKRGKVSDIDFLESEKST